MLNLSPSSPPPARLQHNPEAPSGLLTGPHYQGSPHLPRYPLQLIDDAMPSTQLFQCGKCAWKNRTINCPGPEAPGNVLRGEAGMQNKPFVSCCPLTPHRPKILALVHRFLPLVALSLVLSPPPSSSRRCCTYPSTLAKMSS